MIERAELRYEFGPFRVDPAERLLLRDGKTIPLTPKVFATLLLLIENNGRVLEKGVMLDHLWPDTFVEENSLSKNISLLRKLLGEGHYIETMPKRGYRFRAEVREVCEEVDDRRRPDRSRLSSARAGALDSAVVHARLPKAVAVLPFIMQGARASDEYLGIGLADALITQLGNTGSIVVRPTSAVRAYANSDRDSVNAGRDLGVDAVIEGSVQLVGARVRVTVQMVSVQAAAPLWADKFDTEYTGIFDVQDAISEQVARALFSKLTGENRERLLKRYTENTEAYQSYLKGRYFWNKRNIEGFRKAIEHFKAAIEIDPTFALAFAGLSDTYVLLASWGEQSPREALPRARAAADKALEIDRQLCEAHSSLGNVLYGLWDLGGAEVALKRAIELNPNYATAHNRYAQVLVSLKRFDEAIVEIRRAQQLDPLSAMINTAVGAPYFYARQYDRAIEQYRKALELDPDFVPVLFSLGSALSQQGMFEEAIEAIQRAVVITSRHPLMIAALAGVQGAAGRRDEALKELDALLSGGQVVLPYALALAYARLGDCDRALALLEEAFEQRNTHLHDLNIDPEFEILRSDPRFIDLVRRVGLDT